MENDESLLINTTACVHEIAMSDDESLRLTRVGNVRLEVRARSEKMTEAYLAPRLAKNIVSYGNLDSKGFTFAYDGDKRASTS